MKIIVSFLFVLQLIMGGIWGINSLRVYHTSKIIFPEATEIEISFENIKQYEEFLELMDSKNITISRIIFTDANSISLYSTDPTFNGDILLSEGVFPEINTLQFISNIEQDHEEQVGVIHNLYPDFTMTIRNLGLIGNFNVSGRYQVHTVDHNLLREVELHLNQHARSYYIFPTFPSSSGAISFFTGGFGTVQTMTELAFLILIPAMTLICLIASLIQYSMNQIKRSFILFVHGITKKKIIQSGLTGLLKPFILAGVIAYSIVLTYMIFSGFDMFFWHFVGYFILMYTFLIVCYFSLTLIAMIIVLQAFNSPIAIKGFKPDFLIQILNHSLKFIFIICFLAASHFLLINFKDLVTRSHHASHWETAHNIYRIPISSSWQDNELWFDQVERSIQFFNRISENHQGFFMNSHGILHYDTFGNMAGGMLVTDDIPFEISPFGNRIDITLNYLNINPIQTVGGESIEELVIWDETVLNILVPVHFVNDESEIIRGYLEEFYNQSVMITNSENERLGLPPLERTKEELQINIIYVESGQYYFTFNPNIRPEDGNRIKDPIAVLHTGNYHELHTISVITSGLFFVADSVNPFNEIEPLITEYDLNYSIRFVHSAFDYNSEVISNVASDVTRTLLLIFSLLLTNVIVSYNLIANYFWRHKYVLFMKMLFGFSLLKRHQWFMLSFLGYLIPIIFLTSLIFGINVLILGTLSLVAELITMLIFERRLMKNSFAQIMKGEK